MDPSTEQLITDYLNQVAAAARRSMGPDEVMALVARLRESIDRLCTALGVTGPAEVRDVLAAQGEPEALADREHARLAAARDAQGPDGPARAPAAQEPGSAPVGAMAAVAGARPVPGEASAAGTGKEARGSGGGLLRFAGKPRRLARQRDRQPPAPATTSADPGAETGLADDEQVIHRRSVTSRWRPAEIMPVKGAVRPRGPQGRDSPILQPVKQARTPWRDKAAGAGPQQGAAPAADESRAGLAFVARQGPLPRYRPTAVPKFHPVREPAEAPENFPERKPAVPPSRPAAPGPGSAAGSPPEQTPDPRSASGQEPGFGTASGPAPGRAFRPGAVSGPAPVIRGEPGSAREPLFRPDQVFPPGPAPVFHSEPGRTQDRAGRPAPGSGPEPLFPPEPGDGTWLAEDPDARPGNRERVTAGLAAILARTWVEAREHPLESIAIVLLGLGGLIFPPVWLVGVVVALPSRLWDVRDKWFGLAVPAIVTIVGSAGLAMAASHPSAGGYLHTAVTIGGYLIRAGAVLGAIYLAWRVHRGQRPPPAPPWHRHYR
jgi:hypothetical protein